MRKYIFTKLERELLESWLAGHKKAEENSALDGVLDRIRIHKTRLLSDVHLFIQALRRLNLERRFEK